MLESKISLSLLMGSWTALTSINVIQGLPLKMTRNDSRVHAYLCIQAEGHGIDCSQWLSSAGFVNLVTAQSTL